MTRTTHDNSWRQHLKATLALGLPLVLSHLSQMLVNLTDTIMVGWYGVDELAAVVLAGSIFFVFFIVGSGFAMAVMPMVASAEAAGDDVTVRRVSRMGLWISVIYCTALMPVLWYFEPLMLLLGQKPAIAGLAGDYMRIAMWGMFPAMLLMVVKSFLSALERPGWVLWATVIGAIGNGVFNYALIFGNFGFPELGVRGAAIASVLTQATTFLVVAAYSAYARPTRHYQVFVRIWRSDWPALVDVFRIGWPIGLTMLAETGLFSFSAIMMGWVGTIALATHGIAVQIAAMAFMIYLGLANTVTIRVGRALGRRDRTGIIRAATTVTALQLAMALAMISLFLTAPAFLIGLFLDAGHPDTAAIVRYGSGLLILAAMFQIVDGLQVVFLSILRGMKDTQVPMWCAVVSYWGFGVPAGYLLGFQAGLGGYGIWSGLVVGLGLAAATLVWRFRVVMRKLRF